MKAIYTEVLGSPDPFGRAYNLPAGSSGSDPNGDSRPFQTEDDFRHYSATDYLNTMATNDEYNHGKPNGLDRKSLLSKRPHNVRVYRCAAACVARALTLPADDRPWCRVRQ